MEKDTLAKQISEMIQKTIPEKANVKQVAVYGEVTAASYMIYYYVKTEGNQKWQQCYKMYQELSLSEKTLEKVFSQIAQLLRADFSDEWSNFTLLIKTSTEMPQLLFDNTDLTEGSYEHIQQWEKTYLV